MPLLRRVRMPLTLFVIVSALPARADDATDVPGQPLPWPSSPVCDSTWNDFHAGALRLHLAQTPRDVPDVAPALRWTDAEGTSLTALLVTPSYPLASFPGQDPRQPSSGLGIRRPRSITRITGGLSLDGAEFVALCHSDRVTADGVTMPAIVWRFDETGTTLQTTRETSDRNALPFVFRTETLEERVPMTSPAVTEPAPPPPPTQGPGFLTPWPKRLPCETFRSVEFQVAPLHPDRLRPAPLVQFREADGSTFVAELGRPTWQVRVPDDFTRRKPERLAGGLGGVLLENGALVGRCTGTLGSEHAEPQVAWSFDETGTRVNVVHHVPGKRVAVTEALDRIEGSGRTFVEPGLERRSKDVALIWTAVLASWTSALAQARPFHPMPEVEAMLKEVPPKAGKVTRIPAPPEQVATEGWWRLESPAGKGPRLVIELGPGEPDGWVEIRPALLRGGVALAGFSYSSYGSGPHYELRSGGDSRVSVSAFADEEARSTLVVESWRRVPTAGAKP